MDSLDKKRKYIADLGLLFVAAVWGGGFVATKNALNALTPMYLTSIRFIIATMILYGFFHRRIGKLTKNDVKKASIVGFFLFLGFATQTYGLQFTTASKQGFLTATYVVMVPLLYWVLYRKRPKLKAFTGSLLTLVGIAFISLESNFSLNIGDSLTLFCAIFYAAHIISIEYFAREMDVFKLAFIQIFVAAILSTLTAFIMEPLPLAINSGAWAAIMYLAFFSTFLCFTIQTLAQKYTSSSHASIIMSLESVFSAIFGVMILKEKMSSMVLAGCLFIFIAILIVEIEFKSFKSPKTDLVKKCTID